MKKLITIAILLLSLTSSAQDFKSMFQVSDTLEDGKIVLETKSVGRYVNKADTIETEIYLTYNPKDKFVSVGGIFITDKKVSKNYQFVFKNSAISFKPYSEESDEFFTTNGNVSIEQLFDELKVIRKNGVAFLPIDHSAFYIKEHVEGFERIKCDWL